MNPPRHEPRLRLAKWSSGHSRCGVAAPRTQPQVATTTSPPYNRPALGVTQLGRRGPHATMADRQDQVVTGDSTGQAARSEVVLHLLDSTRDQPLQTWRFADRDEITIGRSDGNDVVVIDPHVSRQHVKLVAHGGAWRLFSLGRHGTLVGSQSVAEFSLCHLAVFRLGPLGPTLRFENGRSQ